MTQQMQTARPNAEGDQPAMLPPVDVYEDDGGITVHVDLPGVSRDRLGVRIDGDNLMIEATASVSVPAEMELHHAEIPNAAYRRSFTLSRELDPSNIKAAMKDGVLVLHIPKSEAAKPRRINVNVG